MKIDAEILPRSLTEIVELSRRAEEFGFSCLWVNETKHDPFIQLAIAASHTNKISLGTSIALAFTRSPVTVAYTAWDLQNFSEGRLLLGLGTQVKGHLTRRFGIKWENPVQKMREYILILRAVWENWQMGNKLEFRGKYYNIDIMTDFFNPGPINKPHIPIFLAAVNPKMCRLAGELCNGLHVHPLHTKLYLQDVILNSLNDGLRKANRKREEIEVALSAFVAVGNNESEIRRMREECRAHIAFYASTRTYRKVMEKHGWGDICERLHEYTIKGRWDKLPSEISDDILREFVVEGYWSDVGYAIKKKYEGLVDRVRLYRTFNGSSEWLELASFFDKERHLS